MNYKLERTSLITLVSVAAIAFVATFFAFDLWMTRGGTPILVPWFYSSVPVGLAVVVLAMAWPVRQYQAGKRGIDPLAAARTLVFAQASSRGGAILAGISGGVALAYARTGPTSALEPSMWGAVAGGGGCLILIVAALVAERWCVVDDTDEDDSATGAQMA